MPSALRPQILPRRHCALPSCVLPARVPCVRAVPARARRNVDMGRRDTSEVLGGTHLARVDLLAAEGVVVGTHIGGVGDDLWLVVVGVADLD